MLIVLARCCAKICESGKVYFEFLVECFVLSLWINTKWLFLKAAEC